MKNKKILMILSKEYTIDPRVKKEAETLVDEGYKVTIIMWDRGNNYKKHEIINGVEIIRLRNTIFMKVLPTNLLRNPFWWRMGYKKANSLVNDFDVIHCHDLDTLRIGVKLKKKYPTKIKLVYDAHEIFGLMIKNNVPKIVTKYAFRMEKKLLKYVDYIITVTQPLVDYFKSISQKPVAVVMNCSRIKNTEINPINNEVFTVSYAGSFDKNRMFPEIIDMMGELNNIKFVVAGRKENIKIYEQVAKKIVNYNNIDFLGEISHTDVLNVVSKSNCILCPLNPDYEYFKSALSNKQFEAMIYGKPVICIKKTYAGDLTKENKCGLVVDYNPDSIKKAIITLKNNPLLCKELGENGFKASKNKYNWDEQKNVLIQVYEK